MESEWLYRGAEATLYPQSWNGFSVVVKTRNPKSYRNESLDKQIRLSRTRDEALILQRAQLAGVLVPSVLFVDALAGTIFLEQIKGMRLKEYFRKKKDTKVAQFVGRLIGKLHSNGLIHGDLTTSNMIVQGKKVFLIDFGLAYYSNKREDQATDLIGLQKTFLATHANFELGWKSILKGYLKSGGKKETIEHIKLIEARARYS